MVTNMYHKISVVKNSMSYLVYGSLYSLQFRHSLIYFYSLVVKQAYAFRTVIQCSKTDRKRRYLTERLEELLEILDFALKFLNAEGRQLLAVRL